MPGGAHRTPRNRLEQDRKNADASPRYRIVRYRVGMQTITIRDGVPLAVAQAHVRDPANRGPGWWDGYERRG